MLRDLPPDAPAVTRLRAGLQALGYLKDNNDDAEQARILHLSFDRETYERHARALREDADGAWLLRTRPSVPGTTTWEALGACPEGSLGRRFADAYKALGIKPFDYRFPVHDDADYLVKRYRETHDLHHIVTGYGVDDLGEVELQAFYWGNLGLRHALLIAASWFPLQFGRPSQVGLVASWRKLRAAWRRGRKARNLLSVRFDELWDVPVEQIARDLGLDPLPQS